MGNEKNIPTPFTVFLLLLNSFVTATVWLRTRGDFRAYWLALSIGVLATAPDEWFCFHERLVQPVAGFLVLLGMQPGNFGLLAYAWAVPGLAIVGIVAVVFVPFLESLPPCVRRPSVFSGCMYVWGAIGMEMVGGWYYEALGFSGRFGHALLAQFEEFFEMAGLLVVFAVLLRARTETPCSAPSGDAFQA